MLKRFLQFQLSLANKGRPLEKLRPLFTALDTFCFEPKIHTKKGPHIRDSIDLKRWMFLVVVALLPCTIMAIWNTGLQQFVYGSGNLQIMQQYSSLPYFTFAFQKGYAPTILKLGAFAFLPIMILCYAVGGLWEGLFACIRGHEISEGFLVTGLLIALILPPTIPYWMVVVGVSMGIVLGKELFGGTGMNILNPALITRSFLFFTYPTKMSGNVWAGTNPTTVRTSLLKINQEAVSAPIDSITKASETLIDGYTQSTPLGIFNVSTDIKRIHVDAIAMNLKQTVPASSRIDAKLEQFSAIKSNSVAALSPSELQNFITSPLDTGGLGLSPDNYADAIAFAKLQYGLDQYTNGNFFFGNMLGSMGETSVLACILGAILLIWTGIGAWRTMVAMGLGAYITGWLFQIGSHFMGGASSLWNPAKFALPAYKHLLLGGLAFGLVFMATDPVSSPGMKLGKWLYGLMIGAVVIVIRLVNPAFPEGVMLAILFGNVFSPLFDHLSLNRFRKKRQRVKATI